MDKNAYLSLEHYRSLLEYYMMKEESLSGRICDLKAERKIIRSSLKELKTLTQHQWLMNDVTGTYKDAASDEIHINEEIYPLEGKWVDKIVFTLNWEGKPMKQADIMKYINALELNFGEGPVKSVSSVLSKKKTVIKSFKREKGYSLYYLKEWCDSTGQLLPQYRPDIETADDLMKHISNNP